MYLVLIEIKRSLWLNELIYAWASKLGDKVSLSNMGLNVCGFGSLCQTWAKITKTQIACYRMEEIITLYYGNFHPWREGKRFCPQTGCSNLITDRTLRSQIFLDKLRRNTWAGPPPTGKSGDSSYWSACSSMWPPWGRKNIKGTPKDLRMRKPKKQPLNTPLWGPS